MAERMEDFDFGRVRSAPRNTYPWDDWLDGSIWKVTRGVDFVCTHKSFLVLLYQTAYKRGGRAQTKWVDRDTLVFQYFEDEEET